MQTTLIDRLIARVAPVHAAKRMQARGQMATFEALANGPGSPLQLPPGGSRWSSMPMPLDAQSDLMPALVFDRAESRNLARFSPIAGGAINTNVDRVVGTGLALIACPQQAILGMSDQQALEWKAKTQAEFALWADGTACDYTGHGNFYQLQELVMRSTLESGDTFTLMPDDATGPTALMPYVLRLQVLEADRVGNPAAQMDTLEMSGGIQVNATGRPTHAHVYNRHPGAAYIGGSLGDPYAGVWQQFTGDTGRKRLLHHFRRLRPGQLRGVPYLTPIVDLLKQMARYSEAEVTAAVVSAMFTVFVTSSDGNAAPIFQGDQPQGQNQPELGLGNGAIVGLAPNEKIELANPNRPNPNFAAFVEGVMTQIGMALGIPRELLMKQFNASYSASKAALLDAWCYFRGVRNWLALSFCQPVYETWLAEAVAIGRIAAPGFFTDPLRRWAYTRAEWRGDSMGSINPKDEIAGYSAAIDARLTTRERATWELFGTDWDAQLPRMASENDRLDAAGILPVAKAGAPAPAPTSDKAATAD